MIKIIFLETIKWLKRRWGYTIVDLERTCGYYFTTGLLGYDPKKVLHDVKMNSGKVMVMRLLDYRTFSDPHDMIDWSTWEYIGYKGEKKLREMTWKEYMVALGVLS